MISFVLILIPFIELGNIAYIGLVKYYAGDQDFYLYPDPNAANYDS